MQKTVSNRTIWVDAIKGLAIILVVFGHTWRSCDLAGLFETAPEGLFAAVDARIYAFHMPLFFMASGFFVLASLRRSSPADFVLSRLTRLIWPLILWTYIFIGSKLVAGSLANDPLTLEPRIFFPIPGQWQFWFLWALFVMHMGLLLLRPALMTERSTRITLWALLLANGLILAINVPFSVYYWTNSAPRFLPFLLLGMLVSSYGLLHARPARAGLIGLAVAMILIAMVPLFPKSNILSAVLSSLICLAILVALSWLAPSLPRLGRCLAWFGGASMIIFLSHTLFAAPVRIVLLKLGVTSLPLHLVLGTLAGLFAPFVLKAMIARTGKPALFGV